MTDIPRRHPQVLCSLVIIRDRSEFGPRPTIRSTAMLTVTRCKAAGARFAVDHHAFGREAFRTDVLSGLSEQIPLEATLIARASRIPQHYLRRSFVAGGPLPLADLQLLQQERPDLDILPIECANRAIEEIAAAHEIERAGPGSTMLSQSRHAPDEAQALWLAFLWSQFPKHERRALAAAWEAWRVIERARPLPF